MNGERHAPGCTYNVDEPCTCGLIARLIGLPPIPAPGRLTPGDGRLSAERLAEIRAEVAGWGPAWTEGVLVATQLLAELDAVTRERDEARDIIARIGADPFVAAAIRATLAVPTRSE